MVWEMLIESLFVFSLNCVKSCELLLSDPLMEQQANISVKLHAASPDPSQTTAAYSRSSLMSCGLKASFEGGGGVGEACDLWAQVAASPIWEGSVPPHPQPSDSCS